MQGFLTLFQKELLRFAKVSVQTVAAPVLTSLLYLLIFSHALEGRVMVFEKISYVYRDGFYKLHRLFSLGHIPRRASALHDY